jgi:hypothetical protein
MPPGATANVIVSRVDLVEEIRRWALWRNGHRAHNDRGALLGWLEKAHDSRTEPERYCITPGCRRRGRDASGLCVLHLKASGVLAWEELWGGAKPRLGLSSSMCRCRGATSPTSPASAAAFSGGRRGTAENAKTSTIANETGLFRMQSGP